MKEDKEVKGKRTALKSFLDKMGGECGRIYVLRSKKDPLLYKLKMWDITFPKKNPELKGKMKSIFDHPYQKMTNKQKESLTDFANSIGGHKPEWRSGCCCLHDYSISFVATFTLTR